MINESSPSMQGQYYYSPATRFQNSFTNPMGNASVPAMGQFGTLGYNPGAGYVPAPGFPQYQNYGTAMSSINQYVDKTVTVGGYNPSNNPALISEDIEKRMLELNRKMNKEQEEQLEKQRQLMNANPYNYYGYINQGYINPYTLSKYKKMQDELYQEAVQNRIAFNKRLSQGARHYLGMEYEEEELDAIYDTREVVIPASNVKDSYEQSKLDQFTVNYSEMEKTKFNIINNTISENHNKIIKPDSDLNTFLNDASMMLYEIEFQKLQAEKRDKTNLYNDNSFSRYLDEQVYRRDGGTLPSAIFPNLSTNSSILEDGTLSIKCPDWVKKNESESNYDLDRQRFIESIYNPT